MYAGGVVLDTTSHETVLRDFMLGTASPAEDTSQPWLQDMMRRPARGPQGLRANDARGIVGLLSCGRFPHIHEDETGEHAAKKGCSDARVVCQNVRGYLFHWWLLWGY